MEEGKKGGTNSFWKQGKTPKKEERHVLFDLAELFEFWCDRVIQAKL